MGRIVETIKFWRIDCDDDRITRVWECGEWLMMDNFYLIADNDDGEWAVPSGALNYQRLVDVLDRKGIFSTKTYVECQGVSDGGSTICEANPNAKAPAPSTNLSYVDAQKAAFKKLHKRRPQ